eukprot:1195210-Prorocentrum_minimum.AAC.5
MPAGVIKMNKVGEDCRFAKQARNRFHRHKRTGHTYYRADIRSAASSLKDCKLAVERLALFSRNEDKDDIATGDLKFLLVPFYLGEVLLQLQAADRKIMLNGAKQEFKQFLSICDDLDVLSVSNAAQCPRRFRAWQGDPANCLKPYESLLRFGSAGIPPGGTDRRQHQEDGKDRALQEGQGEGEDTGEVDYSEDDREVRHLTQRFSYYTYTCIPEINGLYLAGGYTARGVTSFEPTVRDQG